MRLGFGKIFSSDHLCGHPPIIKYLCSASHTRITSLAATTTPLSISVAPPIPKVNNWVEGSVFSCYLPPQFVNLCLIDTAAIIGSNYPLWVISGHMQCKRARPLYPRKRTCAVQLQMSALGQKRTHAVQQKGVAIRSPSRRSAEDVQARQGQTR